MTISKNIILFFCIILINCSSNQNEKMKYAAIKIKHNSGSKQPIKKNFNKLSNEELLEVAKRSKIGRMLIFQNSKILVFSSDGELTYSPFGSDNSVESIQMHYGGIFKVDSQFISNEMYEKKQLITKLIYKNSFIKVYFNQELNKCDIVSANIEDQEIFFPYGIKTSNLKQNFFNNIFVEAKDFDYSGIDTVSNVDEVGEIQEYFIFRNDTLKKIQIQSAYDWIPPN